MTARKNSKTVAAAAAPVVAPTVSSVREWATANGFSLKDRGAIPLAAIVKYNVAHKDNPYVPGNTVRSSHIAKVTGVNDQGETVTVEVDTVKARADLKAAGVNVAARGRLSNVLLGQAVGLVVEPSKATSRNAVGATIRAALREAGFDGVKDKGALSTAEWREAATRGLLDNVEV